LLLLAAIGVAIALAIKSSPPSPLPSANGSGAPADTNASPVASLLPPTNAISESVLNGRWLRPDGGYVMDVRSAQPDGKLDVAYFNPRSINVSRAEWRRESDGLHVFVELRDQNYPGATYKLRYLPENDQLSGEYFQPIYQQTFDVYFIRQPG
jgi:hypothetical protein